ncbi:MAG: chemotaxis protein CheA [Sulfurospirillum sp.]|nr:MAG: chemotaxis protein CheA [Sulfurospirillum sp.]
MSSEIRDFFMEEAEELFDNLHSILLKNEEAGDISDEELDSLFRDVHTLKGGAGSVELTKFSAYTHHLETFMDMLRNHELELNSEIIEFLIEGVGSMQDLLQEEYEESLDEDSYKHQLQTLLQDIEKIKNNQATSQSSETQDIEADDSMNESIAQMMDLFSELVGLIEIIEDSDQISKDDLDSLFRAVHTIKGSSLFLNLHYLPKYLHEVESTLDKVRNGELEYSKEFNEFLSEVAQRSEQILDEELSGKIDDVEFEKDFKNLKQKLGEFSNGDGSGTNDEVPAFELFDEEPQKKEILAFELFDDEPKKDEIPAFELFDEEPAKKEVLAFELFDDEPIEPKKETNQKADKDNTASKKPVKKVADKKAKSATKPSSSSIRVNLEKIDSLMNHVGDLVITKSMLFQFVNTIDDTQMAKDIYERLVDLDRNIRELQESVMSVRMVPMESVYQRLPKMVRDLAKKLGKKVKFEHLGDSVEIDKMMVEGLMDPLTHIIRNSMDHGIEKPEERLKKGKPETGKLIISAEQESGNIIISIKDDGAGINVERVVEKALENGVINEDELNRMSENDKVMLVFQPGLSTAKEVTDVSGRGVGMDVVMNNINSLGGFIKADTTKDRGTEFKIILPLTLAILDGLNITLGDKKLILPLNVIVESLQPKPFMIKHVGENKKEILMLRQEFIPIIRLSKVFGIEQKYKRLEEGMLIVVNYSNTKVALFVDDFLNQEQIVVKSLEKNYKKINGIGATTIRGDGSIGLILDVAGIVEMNKNVKA